MYAEDDTMDLVNLEIAVQVALADGFGVLIDDGTFNDPSELAAAVGMTMDDVLDLWHASDVGVCYPVPRAVISRFTTIATQSYADVEAKTLGLLTSLQAGNRISRHGEVALQ
jgi:hypothetical protein